MIEVSFKGESLHGHAGYDHHKFEDNYWFVHVGLLHVEGSVEKFRKGDREAIVTFYTL